MRVGNAAEFGKNVRRYRGDTPAKDLAKAVRVGQPTLSQWENGKVVGLPKTQTLLKLAKALRVTVDDLLAGVDDEYDSIKREAVAHAGSVLPRHTGPELSLSPINPDKEAPHVDQAGTIAVPAAELAALHELARTLFANLSRILDEDAGASGPGTAPQDSRHSLRAASHRKAPRRHDQ